jgi:hydroxymethylbilane synthase
MSPIVRIGTRGSALARWQAATVARLIADAGGPPTELVVIRTSGDEAGPGSHSAPPDPPAPEPVAVKRLFVKEIEEALLDHRIDLAVHSSKDLPAVLPEGLRLAATLAREDPRDAMVLPLSSAARGWHAVQETLARGSVIGTSSVRRIAALRAAFPLAAFRPIRGNVDTRLRKLDDGECSALVLAAAGLRRLGRETRISAPIPVEVLVPAPGQGIIAIEVADDASRAVVDVVARLSDADAWDALVAERAVMHALGGGCQLPLGVLASIDGQEIGLIGVVTSLDGSRVVRASLAGNRGRAAVTGEKLAAELIAGGAGEILLRASGVTPPPASPSDTK